MPRVLKRDKDKNVGSIGNKSDVMWCGVVSRRDMGWDVITRGAGAGSAPWP